MGKNKGIFKGEFSSAIQELDEPIESGMFDYFRKGKLQCRIIYEDGSYSDFLKKFSASYIIVIKKRNYLVVPSCIIKGKNNSITWYFNNPMPINYIYEQSKMTALQLMSKEKAKNLTDEDKSILIKTTMDSEGLYSVFNTKLLQGLYPTGGMTGKQMLIYAGAVLIVILIILQLTGTVDVIGELNAVIKGA